MIIVVYVNYTNYFHPNIQKLKNEITVLSARIHQESELSKIKKENFSKNLQIHYDSLLFSGKQYSYSQAMGLMQNAINQNAKGNCTVKNITWAQSTETKDWYDRLRMNTSLACNAEDFSYFLNKLKNSKKLYQIENIKMSKDRNRQILNIYMQIVAYRIK